MHLFHSIFGKEFFTKTWMYRLCYCALTGEGIGSISISWASLVWSSWNSPNLLPVDEGSNKFEATKNVKNFLSNKEATNNDKIYKRRWPRLGGASVGLKSNFMQRTADGSSYCTARVTCTCSHCYNTRNSNIMWELPDRECWVSLVQLTSPVTAHRADKVDAECRTTPRHPPHRSTLQSATRRLLES